jgi:hypothetical protein
LSLLVTAFDALLLALALGGFAALLAHPRALALLAVWAAGNAVLAVRRPLAGHDAAAVVPDRGVVMFALFALPLLAAPLAAWGERAGVWPFPWSASYGWAGVALTAAGLAIRIAAMFQLGARFSPRVAIRATMRRRRLGSTPACGIRATRLVARGARAACTFHPAVGPPRRC